MSIFACPSSFQTVKKHGSSGGQVVSVLAFTPTIRVRIPLTPTVFSVKVVIEKNENKQTVAWEGPFFKHCFNSACRAGTRTDNHLKC